MKKSQIALLSVLGFLLVVILAALVFARTVAGNGRDWEKGSSESRHSRTSEYVDRDYDLENFSIISVEGLWEIRVKEGAGYAVNVSYPESWEGGEVFVSGDEIVFGYPTNRSEPDESATAVVTMPDLTGISVGGAASVTFDGFDMAVLDIDIEGAAQLKGLNSEVENLRVYLKGVGHVDFEDLESENAEVLMDGAGGVTLNMTGGMLTGRIDGVGRISYIGEVASEKVSVDGLGKVKYLD